METLNCIIPLCNTGDDFIHRVENVNFLVSAFLAKQTKIKVHLIVVEQVTDKSLDRFLPLLKIPSTLLVSTETVEHPVFCKPWLYNRGVKLATSDHIIVGESDVYCPSDYLSNFLNWSIDKGVKWCFIWKDVMKLTSASRNKVFQGITYSLDAQKITPQPNCCEGMGVYFNRKFWDSIGGANELFRELGGNDNDLAYRARVASGTYLKFPMRLFHLWHPKSCMKPGQGNNSTGYNRILRVYVLARPEEFSLFLKNRTGKDKPLEANVENIIDIYPALKAVAESVRLYGTASKLGPAALQCLKEKDRSRIVKYITFKHVVKVKHTKKGLSNKKLIQMNRRAAELIVMPGRKRTAGWNLLDNTRDKR